MDGQPQLVGGGWAIAAAVVLVLANAAFVAAEFALVRARPSRLKALARRGSRSAEHALYLVQHLDQALSVLQVAITACSLGLGYLGEPAFARFFGVLFGRILLGFGVASDRVAASAAIAASFLFVTFALVVFGELVPKSVAIRLAERVALATAGPIRLFWFASWPLVALLFMVARRLMRWMGLGPLPDEGAHTREEIRQLLALSAKSGQLGAMELALLDNLFRFGKRQARDAMVPRSRVVALDLDRPVAELLTRARQEGYSRYPLVQGDLDHLLGILHIKEFHAALDREGEPLDLRRLARTPLIIPDTLPLDRLLRRFQKDRSHLAIVADEYGAVVGIVTLEDVLEELVGELRDEFDAEEQDAIRPRPGGGYILDPTLTLDRVAELVPDAPPAPEGVHTLAGLLQAELGRLARTGDCVPFGEHYQLVAAAVQGTRIIRVELIPRPQ